jgi:hypothetical protein
MKMMAIGLGKQRGAEVCHSEGFARMDHYVPLFGNAMLRQAKILFGLAIIENAFHQVYRLEAVLADRIPEREPELLEVARSRMGKILIPSFDVLVVDEIGKNHSGDGMDPNVVGRYGTPYATGGPEVQRYVVLDLSRETHGNFVGAGLADFAPRRVYDKIDFDATYPNILTSKVPGPAMLPAIMKNDRTAIQSAIFTCVSIDRQHPRVVRIAHTSNLREILVSEALEDEVRGHPDLSIVEGPFELPFDSAGDLTDLRLGLH